MNQLTVVLITALVTGIVSISGVWFGSYLTRENETEKWRRDHALEAYTELIKAVEIVKFESDRIYIAKDCGTKEHNEQAEVVLDKVAEMDRIARRVFLLAPDTVTPSMNALIDHVGTQIAAKSNKCPKIEESEQVEARKKLAELLSSFGNAARNDLGVHPPRYSVEEWSKLLGSERPWWRLGR